MMPNFYCFLAKLYQTINWEKDINHFLNGIYLMRHRLVSLINQK